jgi:hypothetical protein
MLRTLKNDGQWLEKDLADCHAVYEAKGIAAISKVEPPVRVIYSHPKQIIMLENPYGDFIGCWTVRAGRNIHCLAPLARGWRCRLRPLGFPGGGAVFVAVADRGAAGQRSEKHPLGAC